MFGLERINILVLLVVCSVGLALFNGIVNWMINRSQSRFWTVNYMFLGIVLGLILQSNSLLFLGLWSLNLIGFIVYKLSIKSRVRLALMASGGVVIIEIVMVVLSLFTTAKWLALSLLPLIISSAFLYIRALAQWKASSMIDNVLHNNLIHKMRNDSSNILHKMGDNIDDHMK